MFVIIIGGLVAFGLYVLTRGALPKDDGMNGYEASVISCEFDHSDGTGGGDGGNTNVIVNYTVKNGHTDSRIATVQIEYRDDAGHLVDQDWSQTRWIGAGDTVRGTEMTNLDVPIETGTCRIVGVK